jgi:hypothetical protein
MWFDLSKAVGELGPELVVSTHWQTQPKLALSNLGEWPVRSGESVSDRPIAVSGHLNYCPKGDNGIAIAPPLNIRTLQY